MKIPIGKITFASKNYPREKPSSAVITAYADAMRGGDEFPPIVVTPDYELRDGYHRWKAHLECGDEEVEVEVREDPKGVPPYLFAASLSARHGHQLKNADKREIARKAVEDEDCDLSNSDIADLVGVSRGTVHEWVKDLRNAQKVKRDHKIYHLSLLGWTQQEIATKSGVDQSTASEIMEMSDFGHFHKNITALLHQGLTLEKVAERTGLTERLTEALAMYEMTDQARMKFMKIGVNPYDVWTFNSCDERFGDKHPGRIPGQLIAHALYFFTEPGDVVIDPMSGSGTTQDVCLYMGRKCYGYDIDARHERYDVIEHNILTEGWPARIKKADLIFWDPPYFKKMDKESVGDDGYIEGSISGLSRDEYLTFFEGALTEAYEMARPGTRLAFLMSDWTDDQNEGIEPVSQFHYEKLLRDAGWRWLRTIQAPLGTQQVTASTVTNYRKSKKLAHLQRTLLMVAK